MILNGIVECEGESGSLWLLFLSCYTTTVATEYTTTLQPQSASLSPEMLAFHFPADCLALSDNLLESEASEQQVADDSL